MQGRSPWYFETNYTYGNYPLYWNPKGDRPECIAFTKTSIASTERRKWEVEMTIGVSVYLYVTTLAPRPSSEKIGFSYTRSFIGTSKIRPQAGIVIDFFRSICFQCQNLSLVSL